MKFCRLVLEIHLPQNFFRIHTDTQTDRHFPEIVKSGSGHPKTFKFIQKPEVEIFYETNNFFYLCRKIYF